MTRLHLIPGDLSRTKQHEAWRQTVRILAAEAYGMDPGALLIETDPGGKPFFPGCPGFRFSVSHTEGLLVVAAADREVGVDTEKLRPHTVKVADRFFTPYERDYVYESPEERERRFFTVWTRKEAYLKYTGTGIRVPLASFDVMDGSLPVRMDSFVWNDYVISCCYPE